MDHQAEHAGKKTSASSMQTEVLDESGSEKERDILLPKRMFAASKEDIGQARDRSLPLPGSTDLEPKNMASESNLYKVVGSNPDVVVTSEQIQQKEEKVEPLNEPRVDASPGVLTKLSSRVGLSASGSSKHDPRTPVQPLTQMGSKGTLISFQNSDVISSTIPENELESASLATIEKAEKLEEQKAKKATEGQRRLRVAASTTNIPQAPDEKSGVLNMKRTRSNTDVGSPTHKRTRSNTDVGSPTHKATAKQPTHAKLRTRQSAPAGKTNVAFKPKPKTTSTTTMPTATRTSSGVRPLTRSQSPGRLPPIQAQKGDPQRSSRESRLSSQGETPGSSVTTQPSSGSFSGKRTSSDQLVEGEQRDHSLSNCTPQLVLRFEIGLFCN